MFLHSESAVPAIADVGGRGILCFFPLCPLLCSAMLVSDSALLRFCCVLLCSALLLFSHIFGRGLRGPESSGSAAVPGEEHPLADLEGVAAPHIICQRVPCICPRQVQNLSRSKFASSQISPAHDPVMRLAHRSLRSTHSQRSIFNFRLVLLSQILCSFHLCGSRACVHR
jgi:hypothetical protein